eukprot:12671810-Prorocentrum_lima.AAC.1
MVMPLEDTEALFQAQGKWTSVEDKVHKVCSTSDIGHRMFSFVQKRLVADKLQQIMDEFDPVSYTHLTLPTICSV